MTHICVGNLTIIGSTAPSHYLNKCWNIVNWTLRSKLQWNFNRNLNIFIQENTLQIPSVKWRPFCLGLNVLIRDTVLTLYGFLGVGWFASELCRINSKRRGLGIIIPRVFGLLKAWYVAQIKKSYSFTAEIVILQWTLWHKLPELHLNSSHAISCCVWIVIIYHGTYYSIRIVCLLISFFALPIQTVLYWGRVYVS